MSLNNSYPSPQRIVLDGQYCRLEPLNETHLSDLLEITKGQDERFKYLPEEPPKNHEEIKRWYDLVTNSTEVMTFAVIDKKTGKAEGRQSFLRITPAHAGVEIGSIFYGERISRSRITTEAVYLFANYVFEELKYRRFEWKCNNLNQPSKNAALRFGFTFEGVFRQHMIVKGENRDTAWFSIIDSEWPRIKEGFQSWLNPSNFDQDGNQKTKLNTTNRVESLH